MNILIFPSFAFASRGPGDKMSKGADKSFAEKHKSDRLMFLEGEYGDEDIKNGKAGSFFKMNSGMKILHRN